MPEVIVSHAIELAITPVFLLVGISGLLNVMSTRLARVVDRARYVQQSFSNLHEQARALACTEITHLGRVRRLASWAINFCTAGALLVSDRRHTVRGRLVRHRPARARGRALRVRTGSLDRWAYLLSSGTLSRNALDRYRDREIRAQAPCSQLWRPNE
jgi:hypothetical protein